MKIIIQQILDETCQAAASSERLRMNYNLHDSLDEPVHKMINAFQPGTVLPIHRHLHPAKKETFVLLQGKLEVIIYNEDGTEKNRIELSKESGNLMVELMPEDWHSIEVLIPNTVILEIKQGPYIPFQEIDLMK